MTIGNVKTLNQKDTQFYSYPYVPTYNITDIRKIFLDSERGEECIDLTMLFFFCYQSNNIIVV